MVKKAIFDFDKTLITINSFTYWVFFVWFLSLKNLEIKLLFKITYLIFSRKILKKLSHYEFKKRLLLLEIKSEYDVLFAEKLIKYVNLEIAEELKKLYKCGYVIAISSAAPENYLIFFVNNYFKSENILVIGSKIYKNNLIENFKTNKLNNLIEYNFINRGEDFKFLFTDSVDDISLAKNAESIYLIAPSKKSKQVYLELFDSKIIIKEKAES